MNMISRKILLLIAPRLTDPKAIILLGPRQVGKSTLLRQIQGQLPQPVLWWNGDEPDVRKVFEGASSSRLKTLIGPHKTMIIDEAQRVENIGLLIKLIVDNIPGVKVMATGSSSFDLANKINEPLTGRKWEYRMYPISFAEMVDFHGLMEERRQLEHRLIYGYYPEVVSSPGDEKALLSQLADSYLYKDILSWERILKPDRLERLLQALAMQIGNEVNYSELGQLVGLDNQTVEHYIEILEKAYVVFRLGSFSRNLRNELKKSRKIYFFDNGIRNAIINQFGPLALRSDTGALWENFLVSERMKFLTYQSIGANRFFWRTHAQQEIDYLEEREGVIHAFEFKWNPRKGATVPPAFAKAYPNHTFEVISQENFDSFLV